MKHPPLLKNKILSLHSKIVISVFALHLLLSYGMHCV